MAFHFFKHKKAALSDSLSMTKFKYGFSILLQISCSEQYHLCR